MPKQTFVNLSDSKKSAIDLILIDLYSKYPASLINVSDVVSKADFSRAAFYKYFEDIEDAHQYIIRNSTNAIHGKIMQYIYQNKDDLFLGIRHYLEYVTSLSKDSLEFKKIELLIRNGAAVMPKLEISDDIANNQMVKPWLEILKNNGLRITTPEESLTFLYFIMEMTMDNIGYYILGKETVENTLKDFAYKVKWLEHGIK